MPDKRFHLYCLYVEDPIDSTASERYYLSQECLTFEGLKSLRRTCDGLRYQRNIEKGDFCAWVDLSVATGFRYLGEVDVPAREKVSRKPRSRKRR